MNLALNFVIGFIASVFGSLPPGIISLTVVDATIKKDWRTGMNVALAASFVEFFQAVLAVEFSGYFMHYPSAARYMHLFSIPVFLALAIHHFVWGNPAGQQTETKKYRNGFRTGFLVGAFNVLAVPFWVFWSSYFTANGWIDNGHLSIIIFSLAISAGTFLTLLIYGKLGQLIVSRMQALVKWSNSIIGVIFLTLMAYEIYEIWRA